MSIVNIVAEPTALLGRLLGRRRGVARPLALRPGHERERTRQSRRAFGDTRVTVSAAAAALPTPPQSGACDAVREQMPGPRVVVIDKLRLLRLQPRPIPGRARRGPVVHRHDEVTLAELEALARMPSSCRRARRPEDAGVSNEPIQAFGARGVPVLGSARHQVHRAALRGDVVRGGPRHARQDSPSRTTARACSPGSPTRSRRRATNRGRRGRIGADALAVTAESEDGLVMGLRHRDLPVEGCSFHPNRSSPSGPRASCRNFLAATAPSAVALVAAP